MPSFGVDLWDNFALVSSRTDEGLTSVKDVMGFFKTISKIEADYGKALQKASKSEQKSAFGKKRVETGSNRDAYLAILTEIDNLGNHHLEFAADIMTTVVEPMAAFLKEKEKSRKAYLSDGAKLTKELENGYAALNKVKNDYQKTCKAAEQAQTLYERAASDPNFTVGQVEKVKSKGDSATEKATATDEKYQKALEQTNKIQSDFYTTLFPKVLDDLQALEEERLAFLKDQTVTFTKRFEDLCPLAQATISNMLGQAESIDPDADVQLFINENVSGKAPPTDIVYEPEPFICQIGGGSPIVGGGGGAAAGPNLNNMTPEQLEKEMKRLEGEIAAQQKTKAGIETLIACYGDGTEPKKQVEQQIRDCDEAVAKCQMRLAEVEALLGLPSSGADPVSTPVEGFQAFSLYPYTAQGEGELNFAENEYFWITAEDDAGWWTATNQATNQTGLVPSNYLQAV